MDHSLFSGGGGGNHQVFRVKQKGGRPTEYGRGTIKKIERQLSANKGGSGIIRIFESLIEDPGIGL